MNDFQRQSPKRLTGEEMLALRDPADSRLLGAGLLQPRLARAPHRVSLVAEDPLPGETICLPPNALDTLELRLSTTSHAVIGETDQKVYLPSRGEKGLAYVFQPHEDSQPEFRLLTLNISSPLDSSNLPFSTLSPSLPFLQNGDEVAMTPLVDDRGNISVYTGSCTTGASGSSLWRFIFDQGRTEKGEWVQQTNDGVLDTEADVLTGANFLASGITFSTKVDDQNNNSTAYIFGGMCPSSPSSTDSWTMSANFSNSMLKLKGDLPMIPSADEPSPSSPSYMLKISESRGPPIPEAGFSITPLQPSMMNSSDDILRQQQNFVLIGGHTETAFINMSQVALFSLPEESWTFLPINNPSSERTDLTVRQSSDEVEPRSGHTAVLTADGKKVIVFGGWVGDPSTPADPQLAVLEIGDGYGGTASWQWSTPSSTGPGLEQGEGIYGHGAAMLPGDVMMVLGGYHIPPSGRSKYKRAETSPSAKAYFFNITSNAWLSSYTNPRPDLNRPDGAAANNSGPLSTPSKKAALGSGLSLGLLALAGCALLWCWHSRRQKKKREARDQALRNLSFATQRLESATLDLDGIDGRRGDPSAFSWNGGSELQQQGDPSHWASGGGVQGGGFGEGPGWKDNGGAETERTGLLVEIPSPTRGLRRSLHSRSRGERTMAYHLAPGCDDSRRSLAGTIHPIDERDEYEHEQKVPIGTASGGQREMSEANVLSTAPILDPFRDPNPLGSHPVSTPTTPSSPAQERQLEIQEWVSDWEAADALMHSVAGGAGRTSPGRCSPDKDRTSSTLSDVSARSNISAGSQQQSLSRSISQRSTALFGNPFSSTNTSPTFDQPGGRESPQHRRARSMSMFSQGSQAPNASFASAQTSFPQLQAEGESLLPRPGDPSPPESPTKTKPRGSGWLGSMRRAFPFGYERSTSPGGGDGRRGSPSPPRSDHAAEGGDASPRRAASAGVMYWRSKQGAADWDAAATGERDALNSSPDRATAPREEGDWDVEAAVENRVVQLMFTVPKEKLRVVNAADEEADQESDSESIKDLISDIEGKQAMPGIAR
ncbi:MAG: hypothetical protein M1837_000867 [Sclerophora amabilis]|nr:MAG: hypothetical protein M1837_000867 [Sclerophora amabilis]